MNIQVFACRRKKESIINLYAKKMLTWRFETYRFKYMKRIRNHLTLFGQLKFFDIFSGLGSTVDLDMT